jgi:salicylate hydroxylase
MSDLRSIAVVGGGIGGLTAAAALLRAGFDVRVYEQSGQLCEVGAGIQLGPNCTRILRGLDLLPAIERIGVRPRMFEFRRWEDGRVLSATPLGAELERAYGAPYLHAHRGQLVEQLAAAIPANRLEFGRRCVGVRVQGDRAEVEFADGSRVEADLVIGADGIHSAVRAAVLEAEAPRFTGHVAYRDLVPAERVGHLQLQRNCTVWPGPGACHALLRRGGPAPQRRLHHGGALPGPAAPGPASPGRPRATSHSYGRPSSAGIPW